MMKLSNKQIFQLFSPYLSSHKKNIITVFFALFFTSFLVLILGKAFGYLISESFNKSDFSFLNNSLIIIVTIIFGISISSYTRFSLLNSICEKIISRIKYDIYKKLINSSIEKHEKTKVIDVISRLNNDASMVVEIISTSLPFALRYFVTGLGAIILLLITNFNLSLLIVSIIPIILAPLILIGKYVKKYSNYTQESLVNINSQLDESLSNIKTVQMYNNQDHEISKFQNLLSANLNNSLQRIKFKALLIATIIFIISSSISFILWFGGKKVLFNEINIGDLSSFIYYAIILATSISGISEVTSEIARFKSSINRIAELLISTKVIKNKTSLNNEINSINFENISFSYPERPSIQVLTDINFKINKGDKIAIIGPSGSGKTTLLQLLLGFYNINSGHLKINDADIENFSLESLRNKFILVSQEPVIFSTSIYENILYGNINATKDEVINAAKDAEIFDFIESLPNKFDTQVGEKAIALSSGQKQRIAIARAFLKNPDILLLDEPTSNLDVENARDIHNSFIKLLKDRTSLIITHNPSSLEWVNKVIVINEGKIEAYGSLNEVENSSEFYRKFIANNKDKGKKNSMSKINIDPLFFN